jgi:hypothetical protein
MSCVSSLIIHRTSHVCLSYEHTLCQRYQLLFAVPAAPIQASYELTAMICHIIDEDEADTPPAAAAASAGSSAGLKSPSPTAGRAGNSSSSSRLPHQVRCNYSVSIVYVSKVAHCTMDFVCIAV